MTKLTLLTHNDDLTPFNAEFLETIWLDYFNIELYNPKKTYDKKSTIVVNGRFKDPSWSKQLNAEGYKTIVDSLGELWSPQQPQLSYDAYVCKFAAWERYLKCFWWSWAGYDTYIPKKDFKKIALMPLRMKRVERDQLIKAMEPYLDNMYYSYVALGKTLPNELYTTDSSMFQESTNYDWYDHTYFSIVCETFVSANEKFISEKSFKPIAFYHPFITLAPPNTLIFLKEMGFETFNNLFDESYDEEPNYIKRISRLVENVKNFNCVPYDNLTLEKLEYNRNRFFDKDLCKAKIIEEVINPILEYAET